jgi:polysaccharide biosynthesis/export protein
MRNLHLQIANIASKSDHMGHNILKNIYFINWHSSCVNMAKRLLMENCPMKTSTAFLALSFGLTACVTGPTPMNAPSAAWMPEQAPNAMLGQCLPNQQNAVAAVPEIKGLRQVDVAQLLGLEDRLTSGDVLGVKIGGDKGRLSGDYVIGLDGRIRLEGGVSAPLKGMTVGQAQDALRGQLVGSGQIRDLHGNVHVQMVETASVAVAVSGATFYPGPIRVGERSAEDKAAAGLQGRRGDVNFRRSLIAAIMAAGGVRPDAAIDNVVVIRGQQWARVDLSGFLVGVANTPLPMTDQDRIIVPSSGCFNAQLVRPSALTPPGVKIFMSNLTRSANNNAGAGIDSESTSFAYGSRLLDAAVAGNCAGGNLLTADRSIVQISRNPFNGQSVVIERKVEQLIRNADRDAQNPYLMPGDSVVCYDGTMTNVREVLSMFGDALTPGLLVNGAIK